MSFKKLFKAITIIISIAGLVSVLYVWGKNFLEEKCIDDVNEIDYTSSESDDDEFSSEESLQDFA